MEAAYRHRFVRDTNNPPPMTDTPTARDDRIIAAVDRHGFLNSTHIAALFCDSPTNHKRILNRLSKLYHHRYLERREGRAKDPIVYGLGFRGGRYLGERPGTTRARAAQAERTRSTTRHYERHALAIADFMVAQEISCRALPSLRVAEETELQGGRAVTAT